MLKTSSAEIWVAIHQCLRTYAFVTRRTTDTILIVRAIHETHRTGNRTYEQNYDRFELFLVTCGCIIYVYHGNGVLG